MKKIYNLDKWVLDKNVSNTKRFAEVKINLEYPDIKQFYELKPRQRVKQIDLHFSENLAKLLALNLFNEYEVAGPEKCPRSVKTKIKFSALAKLNKLDFISSVWIQSIDHATKTEAPVIPVDKYFCVKMTVIIEIEGLSPKKQDIEKRFVLIKAQSFDDAYDKLEKQKDNYVEPYLNPSGRFVRWRIDSYDDCYETDINSPADLDSHEGVEVYSRLQSKKSKSKAIWDGKF